MILVIVMMMTTRTLVCSTDTAAGEVEELSDKHGCLLAPFKLGQ